MALPEYVVWFRGFPACPCLAEWLPWFEKVLIARGVVRESIDIAQLIGGATASAGTHSTGGAFDIWQHDPVTQEVGREMGAATFNRVTGSFATNKHTHGVLNDCPHNDPARYQIAALAAGYNGLGYGGRGGRDTGPGPRTLRTWRQGIEWAKKQLEEDMSQYAEQLDRIERKVDRNRDVLVKFRKNVLPRIKELEKGEKDGVRRSQFREVIAALEALAPEDEK